MKDLIEKLTGDKKRLAIIGVAVLVVVGLVIGGVMTLGGGTDDGDLLVDFEDPAFTDPGLGDDPFAGGLSVAEQVEQTIAAMVPTETPMPTVDVGATLSTEQAATRQAMAPVLEVNPLSPQSGLRPYLTEVEVRYMSDMGDAMWAATSMWLHLRQVVYRDVSEWSGAGLDVHMALAASEIVLLETKWERVNDQVGDNDAISAEVKAYIQQLGDGVQAIMSVYRQMEATRALLKTVEGDLEVSQREAVVQAREEMNRGMDRFVEVMGRYGCAVCGELVRRSGG